VYYVADYGGSLRLYREFHRVRVGAGGRAPAAVAEMLHGRPLDPDYHSLWPRATRVLRYRTAGDLATVNLSGDAHHQSGSGAAGEALSVQQLVYTITGSDRSIRRVRLLVAGHEVDDLWGHGAVGRQPLTRAPQLDVLGLIWILRPAQAAAVHSPVRIDVYGTAFEGAVHLQALKGSSVVASRVVITEMGAFREATTRMRLPPGTYTLKTLDENAADGSLIERDSKQFRVVP
jgi:hypothetical protein